MSLDTLIEAAKYVEQQEMRAKQLRSAAATAVMSPVSSPPCPPLPLPPPPPPQHVDQFVTHAQPLVAQAQAPPIAKQQTVQPQEVLKLSPIISSPSLVEVNGFDKSNQSVIIEDGQEVKKRVSTPAALRSGTREVHNKLEKNRRAHLKECFEMLKKQLPPQQDEKKSSNLSILHSALRYIQALKKKERENEHEMERLAREKISAQQRLASLKKEMGVQWDNIDFTTLLPDQTTPAVQLSIKEERSSDTEETAGIVRAVTPSNIREAATSIIRDANTSARVTSTQALQPAQLSVHLPLPQVVSQGLVVGLHKVALVGKSLPLVSSPVTHIITGTPQINGKVVPLVNAQYLMKPVVVVSTPSAASTALSPRPS